jgi:hypothetical protein
MKRGHPLGRGSNSKKRPVPIFSIGSLSAATEHRFKVKLIRACYFFCSISERPLSEAIRSVTHLVLAPRQSVGLAERPVATLEPKGVPTHWQLPPARFALGLKSPFMATSGAVKPSPLRFLRSACAQSRLLGIPKTFSAGLRSFSFTRDLDSPLRFNRKCAQPVFDSQLGRIAFKALSLR